MNIILRKIEVINISKIVIYIYISKIINKKTNPKIVKHKSWFLHMKSVIKY